MDVREALLYKKILGGGGVPQEQIDEIAIAIGLATPSNVENILNELDEIIANSNQTTGESDTTLTDAVQSLIDGYGGGGGLPALMIDSITDTEYTQVEDWLTGTYGNGEHIAITYMPYISGEHHVYICTVSDNSAPAFYAFSGGYSCPTRDSVGYYNGLSARNNWTNTSDGQSAWGSGRSLQISAGAKIRVVDIKIHYPMGV